MTRPQFHANDSASRRRAKQYARLVRYIFEAPGNLLDQCVIWHEQASALATKLGRNVDQDIRDFEGLLRDLEGLLGRFAKQVLDEVNSVVLPWNRPRRSRAVPRGYYRWRGEYWARV